jgi:outer membrane usher protein
MCCRSTTRRLVLPALLLVSGVAVGTEFEMMMIEASANGSQPQPVLVLKDGDARYYFEEVVAESWRLNGDRPPAVVERGIRFLPVAGFEGATAQFDSRAQRLTLTIPPRYLERQVRVVRRPADAVAAAGLGAYLDYELGYGEEGGGDSSLLTGLFEPHLFTPRGVLSNALIYRDGEIDRDDDEFDYLGEGDRYDESNGLIRLETTWTSDDPGRMRSYRAGDGVLYPGMLGVAARFGGVQVASNFDTRPGLVTFPLPSMGGESLYHAQADVYVNGRLSYRDELDPGPFEFSQIPVVTGGGEIRVVTRDLLGREQVIVSDFYASRRLLRPGLAEYAYSAGALRENYGIDSADYGEGFVAGFHRLGVSDRLTVEGQFETTEDLHRLGGGATWSKPRVGVTSLGVSVSEDRDGEDAGSGGTGLMAIVAHEYNNTRWGVSGALRWASEDFRQLGMYEQASRPHLQATASGSLSFVPYGSLGLALSHASFHDDRDQRLVSARYSGRVGRVLSLSCYASFVRNGNDGENDSDYALGVNFTVPLGHRRSTSASLIRDGDDTRIGVQTRYDLPVGPGYGYRFAAATDGGETDWDADLAAQNRVGSYGLQTSHRENGLSWRASASGSAAWIGGRPFLAREIRDAFAVVSVNGFDNVRVYLENQEVARTDHNGQALIPGLRPYQSNRIRIATDDLPLSASIERLEMEVAPYYRSGVLAEFPASDGHHVFLRLRLPTGEAAPEGAVVRVNGLEQRFRVGLDGAVYLTGVRQDIVGSLHWRDQRCELSARVSDAAGPVPDLGVVECR